jgi:hypothetical protein
VSQIFHRSTNTLSKVSLFGALFFVVGLLFLINALQRSSYVTQAGVAREQPVPFSHGHHVRGLGIDCRYCHTSVEESSFAGIPSAKTCMTCHSQIWTNAEMLEPIREAYRTGNPVPWTRVHNLPQYVYFNHSIHVAKGVACVSCHGNVEQMPLMYQQNSLHMQWCLECHRNPQKAIGPRAAVFQPKDVFRRPEAAKDPKPYHLDEPYKLMDCYVCHR